MYNILVCDDEKDIVSALNIYLSSEGYNVIEAYNGKEAVAAVAANEVHLVLMDIMMPVMDGIAAMVELRKSSNVPIILLTAKGTDTDKIFGLNLGADDYITKPFNAVEVIARVKSQLRRYISLGGADEKPCGMSNGGLEIDDKAKSVTLDGKAISLTPREYDILKFFMERIGTVLSPNDIYKNVWFDDPYGSTGTVTVHIRHLREKIEINPSEPKYLKVMWGHGYIMEKL